MQLKNGSMVTKTSNLTKEILQTTVVSNATKSHLSGFRSIMESSYVSIAQAPIEALVCRSASSALWKWTISPTSKSVCFAMAETASSWIS